jgi:putative ABC transport system substrate-binding protein
VFTQVTDPVGEGLVSNLAHPGGNLTGFTSFEFSIGTKWLEVLKHTAPRVTRVALVFDPKSAPFADLFLGPIEAAAPSFSVKPIAAPVRAAADVDQMFDSLARESNGGLMVLSDISMTNHREAIIALAARHRVNRVGESARGPQCLRTALGAGDPFNALTRHLNCATQAAELKKRCRMGRLR